MADTVFLDKLSDAVKGVPFDEALSGFVSCMLLLIASLDVPMADKRTFLKNITEMMEQKLSNAAHVFEHGQLPN